MTTNIIRKALIEYTQMQCKLLGISMQHVPSGFLWDPDKGKWTQEYVDLPICNGEKIILIPKYTVRYQVGVDHATYRSKFVLEFLKAEHLRADDALVTAIKNKKGEITKKVVHKKTVDDYYPKDKEFLAKFSAENPKIVEDYRESLKLLASKIPDIGSGEVTERDLAAHLAANLKDIPPGFKSANNYHNLIIGIISFIYFPNLIYPQKEAEINEGRKRIDITYTNGKDFGFFYRIAIDQDIKANIVHVECKNYSNDIANPEFDQLIGRFDRTRGRLGLLFYRKSEGQAEVIRRCRDAAKSGLGIILPIDDEFVLKALQFIEQGKRDHIDRQIDELFRNVTA
ncbi:hypothetical protein ASL20_13930 [Cupriavidus necator]|nr:hypothetical protein ASL20_13930 [Cupriavidus necator]